MINVGIIGTGFIGPAHIEALRRLGNIQVVAICDSNQAAAETRAAELNVPHAYGDVAAFLQHKGLDAVHNCTPNHLHAEINRQILRAGKHVFSEKPLCMTMEEARELVELAEKAGVIHGVSFVYRQFAMVQQAASMMRYQQLGRLFSAQGSYLQDWMLEETDYNWRVDDGKGGASRAVADIGSHWCDTIQFVTGRKIVEVMADLSIVWPTRKASLNTSATFGTQEEEMQYESRDVTTEDMGFVLFRFDDGSKGSFSVSQVSAGRKNRLSLEVNGSLSSLAWDQETPQQLWLGHRHKANQLLCDDPSLMNPDVAARARFPGGHIEGWPDAFRNMMQQFYQAVEQGKPASPVLSFATFRDGAQVMAIVDAILKSHQQQRWVRISD
ncbi:TPA: Gfo/Idh/MocA family oxidoreductase [Yersinia enterocolitica]|uniref:Gfo/Idh/MocA family protein n=1 Tax=Yersinia aleksiciae TaxID=263819 RepID=UPI0011A08DCE|nr:Gfo/Idh/MocA family oxidoreductase [Yersinia aleksiciae]ELI8170304.1 Gfo/Idh/MocA family oxidoreductase [Yersinia enterocolitica]HDL6596731.1 Gfo/Idh/MocA family oxidoreductase [Yersinia enterocolitica]HDZ9580598.1 Gfo/Idh/MocA family oxidoreductase [Yersinia enterocolitica]HEB5883612.1 Gfo/Idh/MocA family oxidoreductase [Yersinia enterocolitica]